MLQKKTSKPIDSKNNIYFKYINTLRLILLKSVCGCCKVLIIKVILFFFNSERSSFLSSRTFMLIILAFAILPMFINKDKEQWF